ncbi:thiamine pyrophosphate-binding protein [Lacisediminimonas profundi]|uniref:thiamine pyrophosphate-binding protein n=1 Tax=Lacisediminimonas profundi TaxID=2603856 RepID=UPI00124B363F|nr:thiamine pyrophosphate-binding protein [Lacisediminimonas profundi]
MKETSTRSGGHVLIDALKIHGAKTAFCVPGESFLDALDALYTERDSIKLVVCRQEGGAAYMAEAYGKLTGEPGICFVTRGPGATNASIGIHTASQDSTPLIVFVGQVARETAGREAWQEIDYRQMFGNIAKWVDQIDDARRIPEYVSRAFHIATSGRPGPVVLALPEDMLVDQVSVADSPRYQRFETHPAPQVMTKLRSMLATAQRPLVMLGGGAWSDQACKDIAQFAENFNLPVACGFRRHDLMDHRHPNFAGEAGLGMDPRLAARITASDLVIAVGPRLGETTTNAYSLFAIPKPVQQLVHVHRDSGELGRVYRADLMIHAGMDEFASAARALEPMASVPWEDWSAGAREDYRNNLKHTPVRRLVDMGEVMKHLRETLPADSIVVNGAGNYTLWVQRFYQYRGYRTQLTPTSGTMGYEVPASIAAKLVHPERTVVCFAGDGCFLMNGQELATARQHKLNVVFIVVNNGMYGSIRMHQERHYPGRVSGSDLFNPDFVALAKAYGASGELVEDTVDFAAAFARARQHDGPALIELRVDPDVITPRTTITALRAQARPAN